MLQGSFLDKVRKSLESTRLKVSTNQNIAKGTTDPGVDCFDQ